MKNVVKKLIVLTMSAVMLFTAVPMRAAASDDDCDHPVFYRSEIKKKIVNGYSHPYTKKDGTSAECIVDIYVVYYTKTCRDCGFIRTIYLPNEEKHRTNHD